jgi:hypothetical protein
MSVQIIAAIASFIVLFIAWVVLPSRLRKHHASKVNTEIEE